MSATTNYHADEIAALVERFVREVVVPYERDPRRDHHNCPTEELLRIVSSSPA